MNNTTFDRYAEQPPNHWIGHLWLSTSKDGDGFYLRGQILDVAPGRVKVRWRRRRPGADEWVRTDSGTLARSIVKDFVEGDT